jgi:hypothetical protein
MTRSVALVCSVASILLTPTLALAFANGAGVVGNSGKTGSTCNSCHSGGTAPTVAFSGPATLAAGANAQYTVTVSASAPTTTAGIDIATSSGTLVAVSNNIEAVSGELVHTAPVTLNKGVATFQFTVTAPSTGGNITLYAAGLGTNGVDSTANSKAGTATMSITVTGGTTTSPPDLGMGGGGNGGTGGGGNGGHTGGGQDAGTTGPGTTPPPATGNPPADNPMTPGTPSDPGAKQMTGCSVAPGAGDGPGSLALVLLLAGIGLTLLRRTRPQRAPRRR